MPAVAAAFPNTEPLAAKQWYLEQDNAWDFWPTMPQLFPVKVAVIDSGIDGSHPDLVGRVVAGRSFVGGSPFQDTNGHGTFVAGEIAANPTNALGIAGLAFNARLIIAKVVAPDGEVSLPAEVAGIRWAVAQGAQGDQPQPRRRPRPAEPGARLVLAARAGCRRVRLLEGRGRRRGGRQRPAVAGDAVELRRRIRPPCRT